MGAELLDPPGMLNWTPMANLQVGGQQEETSARAGMHWTDTNRKWQPGVQTQWARGQGDSSLEWLAALAREGSVLRYHAGGNHGLAIVAINLEVEGDGRSAGSLQLRSPGVCERPPGLGVGVLHRHGLHGAAGVVDGEAYPAAAAGEVKYCHLHVAGGSAGHAALLHGEVSQSGVGQLGKAQGLDVDVVGLALGALICDRRM